MMEEIYVGVAATGMKDAPANRGLFQFQRASIDNLREAPFLPNESITPAVELHSGSVVLGKIRRADEHTIHFGGTLPPGPISVGKVSRILFRWVPYGLRTRIQSGRSGVLLMNGAFIEGDFKGIDRGRVNISSVLLGLRSFDANNDVMAIVLRRSPLPSSLYEVKTLNGSTWLGPGLRIENGQVVLQEPALGPYPIPLYDILELRRKGGV